MTMINYFFFIGLVIVNITNVQSETPDPINVNILTPVLYENTTPDAVIVRPYTGTGSSATACNSDNNFGYWPKWICDLSNLDKGFINNNFMSGIAQDFKNYLAYSSLEKSKANAVLYSMPPPNINQSIYAGIKYKKIKNNVSTIIASEQYKLATTYFTQDQDVETQKVEFIIDHLRKFCTPTEQDAIGMSSVQANIQNVCKNTFFTYNGDPMSGLINTNPINNTQDIASNTLRIDLPYDLLVSTMLANTTYPNATLQYAGSQLIKNIGYPIIMNQLSGNDLLDFKRVANSLTKNTGGLSEAQIRVNLMNSLNTIQPSAIEKIYSFYKNINYSSYATMILSKMHAERIPVRNAPFVEGVPESVVGLSLLGILEHESNRRFNDPMWKKSLMSLSQEGLLREINSIMALQMVLDFRAERHLENIEFASALNTQAINKKIHESSEKLYSKSTQ